MKIFKKSDGNNFKLSEVNHTIDDFGKSQIAVGEPGSLARVKIEYPRHISILAKLFSKVTSKLEQDNIIQAAREEAKQMATSPDALKEVSQLEPYDPELDISQPSPRERTSPSKPKEDTEEYSYDYGYRNGHLDSFIMGVDHPLGLNMGNSPTQKAYSQGYRDGWDGSPKKNLFKKPMNEGKVKSLLVTALLMLLASTTPPVKNAISKTLHTPEGQKIVSTINHEWNKVPQAQRTVDKAKELWKSAIDHKHFANPNEPLPDEKNMDSWDLAQKYSDRNDQLATQLAPIAKKYLPPEN